MYTEIEVRLTVKTDEKRRFDIREITGKHGAVEQEGIVCWVGWVGVGMEGTVTDGIRGWKYDGAGAIGWDWIGLGRMPSDSTDLHRIRSDLLC